VFDYLVEMGLIAERTEFAEEIYASPHHSLFEMVNQNFYVVGSKESRKCNEYMIVIPGVNEVYEAIRSGYKNSIYGGIDGICIDELGPFLECRCTSNDPRMRALVNIGIAKQRSVKRHGIYVELITTEWMNKHGSNLKRIEICRAPSPAKRAKRIMPCEQKDDGYLSPFDDEFVNNFVAQGLTRPVKM
jgi:hypothetical protein